MLDRYMNTHFSHPYLYLYTFSKERYVAIASANTERLEEMKQDVEKQNGEKVQTTLLIDWENRKITPF